MSIESKTDKTLSELINTVPKYFNTPELKFASSEEKKREVIHNIKKYCDEKNYKYIEIDGLRVTFKDSWAYVRASNTGPNITLRCESKDINNLNNLVKLFETLIDLYNK